MFTFGDFNHELDYILRNSFKNSIFSNRLLSTYKYIPKTDNIPDVKPPPKKWNNISISDNNKIKVKYFGIQNYENCCFLNATLQVLLNSSDFISSLKTYEMRSSGSSETIETLLQYYSQVIPSSVDITTNKNENCITYYGNQLPTLGPCLSLVSLLGFTKNQHEDAEEFLTKLLTQAHEDLLGCEIETFAEDADDEWVEIGRGGKNMAQGRTDGGDMAEDSAISRLLAGKLTEKATRKGRKQNSTVTPFFILPLNLQDDRITDVRSALASLSAPERLSDGSDRQTVISRLPPLLIVQLKRFSYCPSMGVQKIGRQVAATDPLCVPTECLSGTAAGDGEAGRYQLRAVVFHLGAGAARGHYTAAVREGDGPAWLYADDGTLARVQGALAVDWLLGSDLVDPPAGLLAPSLGTAAPRRACVSGPRSPYLLFYSRL